MCPVCFTGGDPVARETLNAGIGVLLGVTILVLALFARFFIALARRSKAAAHLVDHAAAAGGTVPSSPADLATVALDLSTVASATPHLSSVAEAKMERRIA